MRSRSRSGPVDAAEVGRTRRAGQWSSDMPPRTSRSEESSSDGGWSQMSTRPGSDTCSTDGAVGSPTHRLSYARIADTCTHPATDKLPDIAGRLPPWQSRTETGGAFWGMTVGARLHTTYWGLLKQPDNQKSTSNAPPLSLATRDWLLATAFQRAFTACTLGATGEDTSTPPRTWLIPRRADPTQARRSHLDVTWTDATGNESIVGTAGAATSEPLWGITCVAR